jgi:tetratricopeptide (TPR) repeat protein
MELFKMPSDILIDTKGESEEKEIYLRGRSTPFNFLVATRPQKFIVDPKGKILRSSAELEVTVKIALGDDYRDTEEFISAIREYEKAKTLDPRSSLAHYRLGQTYFEQNSYTNAANSLRDSLNGDLKHHWVEAMAQLHLGKIYDILGERSRALAEYRKVLNSNVTYQGADEEAKRLTEQPYSRPKSLIN